ncbi:MAG: phage holin family protein [Ruminococcus sp.]|nr:phage holin family protein [Ruminococcus sp.]
MYKNNASLLRISISTVVSAAGGLCSGFLGGLDRLMITLITVVVIDYITGVIKAICEKKLSSSVGFKGILKKMLIFLIVGLTVSLESIMPESFPLREMAVLFFVANEGISVLENTACFIPLPNKLRSVLAQLKEAGDTSTKDSIETEGKNIQKDPQKPDF